MMQNVEELPKLKQPNATISLMTRPTKVKDAYNRKKLFHMNIQVKHCIV